MAALKTGQVKTKAIVADRKASFAQTPKIMSVSDCVYNIKRGTFNYLENKNDFFTQVLYSH